MAQTLPVYPDLPAYRYTIALDGVQYGLRMAWNATRGAWYLSLETAEGAPLLKSKRVTPYASLTRGLVTGGPPGVLTALGPDPYSRAELTLVYVPEAELALLPADVDAGRVVQLG